MGRRFKLLLTLSLIIGVLNFSFVFADSYPSDEYLNGFKKNDPVYFLKNLKVEDIATHWKPIYLVTGFSVEERGGKSMQILIDSSGITPLGDVILIKHEALSPGAVEPFRCKLTHDEEQLYCMAQNGRFLKVFIREGVDEGENRPLGD